MKSEIVLSVQHFRKTYGSLTAVDDISFEVQHGEIFGLLGPNGAGKTSTLESLEGLRKPDGGKLDILGVDPAKQPLRLRNLIGVQLQSSGLPPMMTVEEAMQFFCAYHGVAPRMDLIERLGLMEKRRDQFNLLSAGQQRRLALALAMAHRPQVLFLDEPTAGLDVPSRIDLHGLMAEIRQNGTTILLATHDMAEAEKMADRVAILLRGRIAAEGTPAQLTAAGNGLTKISVSSESNRLHQNEMAFPAVSQRLVKEEYAVYYSTNPGQTVTAILAYLETSGDRLVDLRVERPSLEERFLEITQVQSQVQG
ncbi:ABC-type multidrug transport system, ATPase component [Longilinea arvoryzae]|uniref:ABC-type multidrug transport system, ATPase component n=1 Tax=Longilinea arvoryzae TaxID=360412 RepID=A0A0S7BF51_9CHLR|nr:ABC transporter ATP-binding protein [Longilinea arvoryzae]GAP14121.1 ABC-type multidrug transport system, ATPase component [Longilinea arvoryzae]